MMRIQCSIVWVVLALALGAGGRAWAAPDVTTVIKTPPFVELDSNRVVMMIGAHRQDGRVVRSLTIEPTIDGAPLDPPVLDHTLQEHSIKGMQAGPTWRAPLALGVVYLFVKGLSEPDKKGTLPIIDGISAYVRQLPERIIIYPTPYGRRRQGRATVTKDDIARIGEGEPLENDHPNLGDAIRLNLSDLRGDSARMKLMLIVTDGRDYADPAMEHSADFAAIGQELRQAGIVPQIVSFQPEADVEQAASNLRDLRDATAAFHGAVDPEGLFPLMESLGQAVSNVRWLEYEIPRAWKLTGGEHRIGGKVVVDGRTMALEDQKLSLPRRTLLLWGVGVSLVLLLGAGSVLALRKTGVEKGQGPSVRPARRSPETKVQVEETVDGNEFPKVVVAVHEMVQKGISAERAASQLLARFPEQARSLVTTDAATLPDELFPVFHTRAGLNRFEDIKKLLTNPEGRGGAVQVPERLMDILADLAREKTNVRDAASNVVARIPQRDLKSFADMRMDEVAEFLRRSSAKRPELGSPKARGICLSLQDTLRKRTSSVVSVGWLVCATGPMKRGSTLRLGSAQNVVGSGTSVHLRLNDPSVLPEHLFIEGSTDKFVVTAAAGPVSVDGQPLTSARTLVDGETITIGSGDYIFKQASG